MANIPIRIIQRGTTTLKTKGKVCREDIDVIVEVEGGQNYLVAKNEAEMNMFLANEKYVGSFVRYIGASGTYIQGECYLISNEQLEYPQYIAFIEVATEDDLPSDSVDGTVAIVG